ncbi:MAG: hypothetical protein Gaeavirus14_5 [Gaeavirus sp.]|nr:MAG: hypothetical protein Gaeavirus14_5 [Gaeavirus sp.]
MHNEDIINKFIKLPYGCIVQTNRGELILK